MMLGPVDGCAVRLTPGAVGPKLNVAEGIETALAVWAATGLPTWAALSANGIRSLILPPLPEAQEITIAADNDQTLTGIQAALDAAAQWTAEGRIVQIAAAPKLGDGGKGHDFNDLLQARGLGAVQLLISRAEVWTPEAPASDEIVLPAATLPKGVIPGIKPRFPAQAMDATTVRSKLDLIVSEFLAESLKSAKVRHEIRNAKAEAADCFLAVNPELDPTLNYEINLKDRRNPSTKQYIRVMAGVRREAKAKVLEKWGLKSAPATLRYQIAAGAGSGKTEAVIRAIAASDEARQAVFHYYVPNHALAAGVAERFKAAGVRAWILRGRTAKGDDGIPTCEKPRLAARVGELGLNVTRSICKDDASQCEHIDECSYWRQIAEMTGPGIVIMPHEYLTLPKPEGLPAADIVIVDENARASLIAHKSLDPSELGEARDWGAGSAETADFLAVCRKVRDALLEDGPTKSALAKHGITPDDLVGASNFAAAAMDNFAVISPDMSELSGLKALEHFKPSPRSAIAALLARLTAEMNQERDQIHGVNVRSVSATVDQTGEAASHRRIYVHYQKPLKIKNTLPILHIDAGADEEQGGILWGHGVRHFSLPVRRNATIVQAADQKFSKSALLVTRATAADKANTIIRRLDQVRRFILAQVAIYGPGKVLVVTYKPVRRAITGEASEGTLPTGCDWKGATVASFGNIRGIDDFKHYHCAIIIGREQMTAIDLEAIARALYCDAYEPLNLTCQYVEQPSGYRMADGSEVGVRDWMHPDPRINRILYQTREHGNEQAIDRLRPVHRVEPAKVFILGKLPIDATVNQLVTFDDLLLGAEIEAAILRYGALPLSAEWLAEFEPSLFVDKRKAKPSIRAIKQALAETGLVDGAKCRTPIRSIYRSSALWSLAIYRTRRGGRERRALVHLMHTDPRAALSAVLGEEVLEFRLLQLRVVETPVPQAAGRDTEENPISAIPELPIQPNPVAPTLRIVELGEVMPFYKHPLGERSEIVVTPPMSFPELTVWDATGQRPVGWNFGLPLPAEYRAVPDEAA